jgi:hypothetical protein
MSHVRYYRRGCRLGAAKTGMLVMFVMLTLNDLTFSNNRRWG